MAKMATANKSVLAEKLTLQILQQVKPLEGLGDHWGKMAADAYVACYKKLGEQDFD